MLLLLKLHDCDPRHGDNFVVRFTNDTTKVGPISNSNETSYQEEINKLAEWYNLLLNVSKNKELIDDFRKNETKSHRPVYMS